MTRDKYIAEHSALSGNGKAPRTEAAWNELKAKIKARDWITKESAIRLLSEHLAESSAARLLAVAVHDGHLEQVKSRGNLTWFRFPVSEPSWVTSYFDGKEMYRPGDTAESARARSKETLRGLGDLL